MLEPTSNQENKYDATKETPQWEREFNRRYSCWGLNDITITPEGISEIKEFIRNLLRQQEEFWELKLEEEKQINLWKLNAKD